MFKIISILPILFVCSQFLKADFSQPPRISRCVKASFDCKLTPINSLNSAIKEPTRAFFYIKFQTPFSNRFCGIQGQMTITRGTVDYGPDKGKRINIARDISLTSWTQEGRFPRASRIVLLSNDDPSETFFSLHYLDFDRNTTDFSGELTYYNRQGEGERFSINKKDCH